MTVAPEGGLLHSPTAIGYGAHRNAVLPALIQPVVNVLIVLDAHGFAFSQNWSQRSASAEKDSVYCPRAKFPVQILLNHHVHVHIGAIDTIIDSPALGQSRRERRGRTPPPVVKPHRPRPAAGVPECHRGTSPFPLL